MLVNSEYFDLFVLERNIFRRVGRIFLKGIVLLVFNTPSTVDRPSRWNNRYIYSILKKVRRVEIRKRYSVKRVLLFYK